VTQTLPAGAYDKATKIGWKVYKKRTKWTWSHPKDAAPGGFVKAVVAVKKGTLTVGLKGQKAGYAATAPATMQVTFPANGACVRTDFAPPAKGCTVKSKGKTLVCK